MAESGEDLSDQQVVSTEVVGDVREYHYSCDGGHEFSVLMRPYLSARDVTDCVVDQCVFNAELKGDQPASVGKSIAELAEN